MWSLKPGAGRGFVHSIRSTAVLPDAVVVGEDAEPRRVVDVDLAVEILDAEDRVEALREDGDLAVGMDAEDPVDRLVHRPVHVHRIFADEEPSVGREAVDRRELEVGILRDDLDLPVGRALRRRFLGEKNGRRRRRCSAWRVVPPRG
jgi:hypothetical protein